MEQSRIVGHVAGHVYYHHPVAFSCANFVHVALMVADPAAKRLPVAVPESATMSRPGDDGGPGLGQARGGYDRVPACGVKTIRFSIGVAKNLTGPRLRRRLAAFRYPKAARFSDRQSGVSFKVDDDVSTRRSE